MPNPEQKENPMSNETQAQRAVRILHERSGDQWGTPPAALGIEGVRRVEFEDGSVIEWGWAGWTLPWTPARHEHPASGDAPTLGG